MLSSGFGHSGPRDLHNGITAYSSITIFEYANLLMLVTVIPLSWLVHSWGILWALFWQQGFSCWFLISSCGRRGKPLDQLPQVERERKAKREGCEIQKKGVSFFKRAWMPFPLLFSLQEHMFILLVRDGMGHLAPSHPLLQGFVLAVTVPYFCLPWLIPAWKLTSELLVVYWLRWSQLSVRQERSSAEDLLAWVEGWGNLGSQYLSVRGLGLPVPAWWLLWTKEGLVNCRAV